MSVSEALRNWDHLALSVLDISYLFLSHVTLLMHEFPEIIVKKIRYHLKTFFTRIHASKKILNFVDHESYYTSGASILHFEFIMGPDHLFSFYTQCPRTDLNERFLSRPKTTTAWKLTPHRSKISKNWNPHWWVPLHRFFKNWFLLIQKQLHSNYIQTHFTK